MLNVEISEAVFVHLHIIFDKDVLLWGTEKKKKAIIVTNSEQKKK